MNLRAELVAKMRNLAEVRCQNMIQVFKLMFNAPDEEIMRRMRAGLDAYEPQADFGRICIRVDDETHQRLTRLADTQGYTIGQFVTMVLSESDDVLLDYADEGINRNIEAFNQKGFVDANPRP